MRTAFILLACFAALTDAHAAAFAQSRSRESAAAYRGVQQGDLLPLHVIRDRVRVPGAEFIGADLVGDRYRLRYMRGPNVILVEVDARTGRVISTSGL